MSDTDKHTSSLTYGQVVVRLLLGFGSLSKPQSKYEQNGRTSKQNMAENACFWLSTDIQDRGDQSLID